MTTLKYFPFLYFLVLGNSGLQARESFTITPGSVSEVAWDDGTEVFTITLTENFITGDGGGSFPDINGNAPAASLPGGSSADMELVPPPGLEITPQVSLIARAGDDQTVDAGATVTLEGGGSTGPFGVIHLWTQVGGTPTVTLTPRSSTARRFTAPTVTTTTVLTFRLTIRVGENSVTDDVAITVRNNAPVANAGTDQTVAEGATVTLTGSGTDLESQPLTYLWTQTSGTPMVSLSDAAVASPTFTAPTGLMTAAVLTFSLTVNDGGLDSAPATVTITVATGANAAPVANAGTDQTVAEGATVTLTGSGTDTESQPLTYLWTQTGGTPMVSLSDAAVASPTFTAPTLLLTNAVLTFSLTVSDGINDSAPATVTITVTAEGNDAPVANAGPDQTVAEGVTVTLTGSGTDTESQPLTYLWTQTGGEAVSLSDNTAQSPTFTAPTQLLTNAVLTFSLTTNDGVQNSAPATVTITVTAGPNDPPFANAGNDQTVAEGATVTLFPAGIDPEGQPLTYLWTQTGGEAVSLSDNTAQCPTFTAPMNLLLDAVLTFSLTVSDGVNDSTPNTVTITVTAAGSLDDFVTTWRVAAGDLNITLPTTGGSTYDYSVVWGDGMADVNQTGKVTHAYAMAGDYEVHISGTFPRIYFNNTGDKDKLRTVQQWGTISWTSMAGAFFGCSNLTIPATDAPDLTRVTDMSSMFNSAGSFNQNLSTWNVSNVTDMMGMLDNSGLSSINYDNLLTGWAALTLQPDVTLGAAGINYCTGAAGRTTLAGTPNNWIITDAGLLCGTDITAFSFTEQTGAAVIDEAAYTVAVGVAAGTSLTALTPTIAVSSGATIAPASGAAQDFTNDVVYTVTAQDGSTTQAWTVTVNVPPADIALANSSIDENNAVNAVIGGLSATDGNASDSHTYSLVAGTGDTDNASFSISGSNLVAAVVFDYEAKSAYSVRIAADDSNGGTFEKAFALTVNDVTNASQTITFDALAAMTFGDAGFDPGATATSGLDVTYSSSAPSVASIAGNMVTIVGAGTTVITASQAGDADYIAATDVTQTLVVNQADQTIDLAPVSTKGDIDAPFEVGVSSTSGLLVTLTVSSGPATISGTTLTLTGDLGIVTITADQAGNDNYNAAPSVVQSFEVVTKQAQTITFGALAAVTFGGADFNLAATASSTLNVSYSSSDPSVASIAGNMVTIVGAGTTIITASQAGDINYIAAPDVAQNLVVNKADQTINFGMLSAVTFGGASFNLTATASSTLNVSYSSSDPSVASIAGNMVTIVGAGTTVITASQAGDDDYIAAMDVAQDLVVNQADQTITLTPVADKVTTDAPFDVAVSSTSGLAVTLTVNGPATISATTLTLEGTEGTVTITADQAGNSNYNTAPSVEESFDVVDMRTVTGLEEEAPANKIILHPIPANNTIYIDMGDQKLLEMTVTDLNGKQLTVHAQDSRLDISSLKQGYYILRITTDQGVFSQKIIKQ